MRLSGSEKELRQQLARYIKIHHPTVLYRFDLAADIKLTVGQAAQHKRLHPHRGWPDFMIFQSNFFPGTATPAAGLALELKRDGESPYLKDGKTLKKNEHVHEQADILEQLRNQGWYAEFAVGFEQAVRYIESYLDQSDYLSSAINSMRSTF